VFGTPALDPALTPNARFSVPTSASRLSYSVRELEPELNLE